MNIGIVGLTLLSIAVYRIYKTIHHIPISYKLLTLESILYQAYQLSYLANLLVLL